VANTLLDFAIVGAFVLLFIGVIALGMLQKSQRKSQIKAYKKRPIPEAGKPILVQGKAGGPSLKLPTTGEPVAFYSISLTARNWSGTVRSKGTLTINGMPLGSKTENLEDVRGTMAFERSGDFIVSGAGKNHAIRVDDAFAFFESGIAFAKNQVPGGGIVQGAQKTRLELAMEQQACESILALMFGFVNPIHNTTSMRSKGSIFGKEERKDYYGPDPLRGLGAGKSNVSIRTSQFVYGRDVPSAILSMLRRKSGASELLHEGDEIWAVENYIPYGHSVFVFGTYDGNGNITFADGTTGLSVSYADPETL